MKKPLNEIEIRFVSEKWVVFCNGEEGNSFDNPEDAAYYGKKIENATFCEFDQFSENVCAPIKPVYLKHGRQKSVFIDEQKKGDAGRFHALFRQENSTPDTEDDSRM